MKKITINVYTINELEKKAFENAYNYFCEHIAWWVYQEDYFNSLRKVLKEWFGIDYNFAEYGRLRGAQYPERFDTNFRREMCRKISENVKPKQYGKRKSKIFKVPCIVSHDGYLEEFILENWREWKTFNAFINAVVKLTEKLADSETSEETCRDFYENNDYLFYSNGTIYKESE